MKKFLILLLVVGAVTFSSSFFAYDSSIDTTDSMECQNGTCNGIAKSTGVRCKSCIPNAGGLYCANHR